MDQSRWQKIQELLDGALERSGSSREEYLREQCGDDAELLEELQALVAASERSQGPLEHLGGSPAPGADAGAPEGPDGHVHIGPYRLIHVLGEGGMGVVWLAEQREPVRRRVALKIMKPGLDTKEVVARFESERQALALMEHDAIARVLDAGATADGRPYFAMELVQGTPITEYCDTHRLSTRERLQLFGRVCRGVQHAHQKGVIHRDLKPSNVLVTLKDGEPTPKIIDFGIAKATGGGLTDRTLVTLHGQMVGTPTYMSPEQADVTALDVDTRTDIYSLGVVLYELLVGAPPVDLRRVAIQAMGYAIRETDVPRPSEKATSLGDSLTTIATFRRTDPEGLKRDLRDDLDWIVLKAMEKDRTRRYDSAAGFAEDIARHLNDEPVVARPPSSAYRITKFVRRHRGGVATIAAAFIGLVAFGVTVSVQSRRVADERDKAVEVSAFLEDLFRGADPMAGNAERRDTLRLRAFLAEGAERVRADLDGQPEVQAHMMDVLGRVYRNWGEFDEARPLLERALELRSELHSEDHADVVGTTESLALVMIDLGNHEEGEALLRETIALRERHHPDARGALARSHQGLGNALQKQGRYPEAEASYRAALRLLDVGGAPDPSLASALSNLGTALVQQAEYEEAEGLFRRALQINREERGGDHPDVANNLNNLAFLLEDVGRIEESEGMLREALDIRRTRLGPAHPLLAVSINNLANTLLTKGDMDEAVELFRESLAMREELLGEDHPATGVAKANLAAALDRAGVVGESADLYAEALTTLTAALGTDHPAVATTSGNLAAALHKQGRHGDAIARYRTTLSIRREKLPAGHYLTASILSDLGRCLREVHAYDESETTLLEAHTILEPLQDEQGRRWDTVLRRLADLYDELGRGDEADRYRVLQEG